MPTSGDASVPGAASPGVPTDGRQPPQWLPVPPVPQQNGAVSRPSASRDWYMNGNYLVILVSVTIILPLALMKQLGKSEGCRLRHRRPAPRGDDVSLGVVGKEGAPSQREGPARTHRPLSSLPRLPRLRQWLLPQLYGLLPHLGEHLSARAGGSGCRASFLAGCGGSAGARPGCVQW